MSRLQTPQSRTFGLLDAAFLIFLASGFGIDLHVYNAPPPGVSQRRIFAPQVPG